MMHRELTSVQVDVLDLLDSVYPRALTTPEVIERRTGQRYDSNESYRALRGLEARGIVTVLRDRALRTVAWAVIR